MYAKAVIDSKEKIDYEHCQKSKNCEDLRKTIEDLDRQKKQLLAVNNYLFELLMEEQIADDEYKRKASANSEKVGQIETSIAECKKQIEVLSGDRDKAANIKLLETLLSIDSLNKDLTDRLVKSIDVSKGGKI